MACFRRCLAGTILAGILASTMSTADSQLLAASSAVSSDLAWKCPEESFRQEGARMVADRVTVAVDRSRSAVIMAT